MNDTEKINYHEFSERIRAKYPNEYDDMDDEALAKAVVKKYPEYSDWVQFDKGITDYITGGVPLSSAPGELLKAALAGATGLVAKIPETVQRMADNLAVADYNIPNVYPNYPVNYAPLINQNNQSIPSYPNNYSPQTSHNIQALAPKPILNVDVLGAVSNIAGKASRGIKEWGNETFEAHPALQGSFLDNPSLLKAGALMANAVPSLVGAAAIAAATKSPTFAAGLLGLGDTGDYDEMVSEITKQNIEKGQDEKTARKNAIKQANATMNVEALTSAVWEKYGLEGVLKGGGKLGKRIFTGGAKESGTESGQQITQNIIEKISYDPNRNIFENVPDAAIGAFGSGGLVSAFAGRGNTQNALPPKKDTNVVELDIPPFNPLGNQQKQTTQTQDTQQTENKETQAGDQTQTTQQTQDTDLRGQVIAQEASEIDKKIEAVERRRAKETQKLNNDEAPAQEHQEAIKTIDILDNQINELEKQKNSLLENTQNTGNQQTQTTQAAQTQTANQPTTTNTNEAGVGIFKTETTTQTQTATGQNIDLATKKIDIRIQSVERRRNREVETLNNENISANERNKAAENIKILDNRINRLKERKNNLLENPQGAEILNDIDKTNKLIEKRNRELGELKEQSASGKISQEAYQKRAEQIVRDIERSLTKNEILSGLDEVMRANNTQTQNTAAIEQRIKTLENLIDRSRINGKSILSQKEFRTLQEEYKRTQNMRYKINDGSQQSSIRRAQVANEQTQGAPAQTGTQSTNVNNNETKIEVFNKEKSNEKGAERIKKFAKKIFNKDTAPVIKLLKEKILTENGQKAIGEYVDGVIKVFNGENSDKTFIHESAHYIFDQFLTADEKRILFKQGYREYKAEIDAYRKKYYPNEAITYAIEEVLADKLAEYGVSRQGVSGQIKLIFEAIIRRMKGYVGAQEDIKDFYNSVMSGEVAGQGRNENASSQDRRYNKGISDNENVLALLPPKEYYENPETDYNFPDLNNQDLELLNKKSKPVILKRNIVEKEKVNHKEIPIEQYNEILNGALYNADIIIKDKPQDKPNYYLFVKREIKNGKSVSTLIELNESKENFEIVGWQKLNENSLRYKIKRAGREGGQVLITKRGKPQGAAVLSALSSGKENIAKTDTKNKKPKYQIIGEKGAAALDAAEEATTRLDNLNVAREMEKAGKDARAIRLATGWERGAEGKWRYEIDDVKIEWSINSRTSLKMDLSEFLLDRTSEELFKAYPELAGVRIVVYPSNQKEDGYYDENNNMIFINSASPNPEMTLIHEIQHVIQYIEGFAEGTNLDDTYSELKSERNQALSPVFREALEETGLIDERGELKEEYTNEIGVRFFIFDSQVSDIVYGYKN
ncbi:MAG: hypothetical protein LBQ37_02115, partial [Elusimicrobiota bacterium]|nr:hypothetical protein [Elusimicrobiota bacterium]